MTAEQLMLCALSVPLLGSVAIAASGRHECLRDAISLLTGAALLGLVAAQVPPVLEGARPTVQLMVLFPGLPIAFTLEPLGGLFALIASGLWLVSSIYSIGYMRANQERHQTRFYACFAAAIASAIGIAFAANLITLFLFYEVLTLVTYPLVTHQGTDEARRGGRVYLALLLGTSMMFLLPAIAYTWHVGGTTDFRAGGILPAHLPVGTIAVLLALYMFGIGKAALMPFHRWLPAAMVAPAPVSALLHAVAVVKAGVFTVIKVVVYVFGLDALAGTTDWLIALAGFTIIAASVIALRSDNLKRRLAYSTVSQLSYIIMATAMLAPLSVAAAVFHLAAHALGKITLFFAAGAVYTTAHKTEVSQLNGIGLRMPWTMGAFAVGALSMIGLPPAAGFISKWYMLTSAMSTGHWIVVTVIVVSTLLNAGYFLPVIHRAFFRMPPAAALPAAHGEAPLPIVIALTLTAAGTLALFLAPDALLAFALAILEKP